MNALEARNIAEPIRKLKTEKFIEHIFELIQIAAQKGLTSLVIPSSSVEEFIDVKMVTNSLTEKGYSVNPYIDIIISW